MTIPAVGLRTTWGGFERLLLSFGAHMLERGLAPAIGYHREGNAIGLRIDYAKGSGKPQFWIFVPIFKAA